MCLEIRVKFDDLNYDNAVALAQCVSGDGVYLVSARNAGKLFRKKEPFLVICPDGSCACSLLTDQADWGADTWDMDPDLLPKLAVTIEELSRHATLPMTVEALWVGDEPLKRVQLTLNAFLDIVRTGRLGTRTAYDVVSA